MRICAGIGHLFTDLPLVERFDAALDAGYDGVELTLPYDTPAEELRAARERSGAPVVLFTAPVGDFMSGGEGLAAVPGREAAFRDSIAEAFEYAEALQAELVQVLAGRCLAGNAQRQHYLETFAENLCFAREAFAAVDTRVVIEPINRRDFPHYLLGTPDEAREALAVEGHDVQALVLDTVHLSVMGIDPVVELRSHGGEYAHVQWADMPDRTAPGSGELDFQAILRAMVEGGYRGWVGAEYHPGRDDPDWKSFFS